MLALTLESRLSDADELNVTAYAVHYELDLFNDFTFQLRDKANFDEIEQTDARIYGGLNATFRHRATLGSVRTVTTLGLQIRGDSTTVGLWHAKQRVRLATCAPVGEAPLNPCTLDDVVQWDVAAFLQEDVRFTPWLRVLLGVRGDLFRWHVDDRTVEAGIVNPKLQAIITPHTGWELYLDAGGGFHSNDARAVVASNGSGSLAPGVGSGGRHPAVTVRPAAGAGSRALGHPSAVRAGLRRRRGHDPGLGGDRPLRGGPRGPPRNPSLDVGRLRPHPGPRRVHPGPGERERRRPRPHLHRAGRAQRPPSGRLARTRRRALGG